ncbi:MAG TPA: BrnT family toxin [Burkholderiales bacterium]|nr:BrnT family toxin [Burkholderiales bacterium]
MAKTRFDWDQDKDGKNQKKHGVSFALAQLAFADSRRVIAEDLSHGSSEQRYFCLGQVGAGVLTVRFVYRENVIRIHGAGYWRKGKRIYERENQIHGRTPREPQGRS